MTTTSPPHATHWPEPPRARLLGHLPGWTHDGLGLLEAGARTGPVFALQLWRKALVGYRPDWNRFVLGDTETFRSHGSLSQLSPYLSGGVVATDEPGHRLRRAELNPAFHRRVVTERFADVFSEIARDALPTGAFDARTWASELVYRMIKAAFVGPRFPDAVLQAFLAPLDRPLPSPLLRRPFKIRRLERDLRRAFADPDPATLAPLFADLDGGVEEARVALAAAYDTTAHTLTFALWELALHPEFNDAAVTADVVAEALRLYPAGWIGSRVTAVDTEFDGRHIPAGRLVLYSPFLTHRDADLWDRPSEFRPERFADPRPAWGYLPFSAGSRTCLGAGLATLMLRTAVSTFAGKALTPISTSVAPRGGITLTPSGPVLLHRSGR